MSAYDLVWTLGPLTVRVEGVPDVIPPNALSVDVDLHPGNASRLPEGVDVNEHMVAVFDALGGLRTFPETSPTSEFSIEAKAQSVANGGQPTDGEPFAAAELQIFLTGVPDRHSGALLERLRSGEAGAQAAELRRRADALEGEAIAAGEEVVPEDEAAFDRMRQTLRERAEHLRAQADALEAGTS